MGENAQAATPCFDPYGTGKEKRSRTTKKVVIDGTEVGVGVAVQVRGENGTWPDGVVKSVISSSRVMVKVLGTAVVKDFATLTSVCPLSQVLLPTKNLEQWGH